MKCKICGKSTRDLAAMGRHYRKDHPSKIKRGRTTHPTMHRGDRAKIESYCPTCGRRL